MFDHFFVMDDTQNVKLKNKIVPLTFNIGKGCSDVVTMIFLSLSRFYFVLDFEFSGKFKKEEGFTTLSLLFHNNFVVPGSTPRKK